MLYGNINDQYRKQAVSTMTQGEMLVFLYDEIIKRLNRAKLCLEAQNFQMFESDLTRAREIVMYFEQTLDRKYSISAELQRLYDFIIHQISRAQAGRNVAAIDEVLPFVIEFRDTWKEADRLSKTRS
jgi:flagellar protein FliS